MIDFLSFVRSSIARFLKHSQLNKFLFDLRCIHPHSVNFSMVQVASFTSDQIEWTHNSVIPSAVVIQIECCNLGYIIMMYQVHCTYIQFIHPLVAVNYTFGRINVTTFRTSHPDEVYVPKRCMS